ncbi:MAG: hypothetical protein U5N85_02555 [Arcicella sp.]|nr:hypothetical protein [Arcicella sp.]
MKIKIILLVVVFIIVIFLAGLYYLLTDRVKDVSTNIPYTEIINKDLISIRPSILIENYNFEFVKEYPKGLNNYENIDTSQVAHITVPEGSIFKFHKALQIQNAGSGFIYSYLLGEVKLAKSNEKYAVMYSWGFLKEDIFQKTDSYWEFKIAPWQIEKTRNIYLKRD